MKELLIIIDIMLISIDIVFGLNIIENITHPKNSNMLYVNAMGICEIVFCIIFMCISNTLKRFTDEQICNIATKILVVLIIIGFVLYLIKRNTKE